MGLDHTLEEMMGQLGEYTQTNNLRMIHPPKKKKTSNECHDI